MALLAILVLTATLPSGVAAAPPVTIPGILTQPAAPDGCVSNDGTGGACATVGNLVGAQAVAVSPDNLHVYVTAFDVDAVTVFSRDKTTSVLTKVGCYTNNATAGCTQVKPLTQPYAIAVTPDGKFVYVSVQGSDAVVVFARDKKTGRLTKQSCVGRGSTGGCAHPISPLNHPQGLAISKDGKFVFVAVRVSDAVIAFARDKKTGALTKVNCVSNADSSAGCTVGVALDDPRDVAVSKDSKNVYVASKGSNAVVVLSVDKKTGSIAPLSDGGGTDGCVSADGTGGACATGKALGAPLRLDISPDGKHVYVASSDSHAVAMFSRGKQGALSQIGCISNDGSGGDCTTGNALAGAASVAVSQDGKNVYVAAKVSDAVGVYSRDKKTGLLTQLSPTDGCVSLDGTGGACATGAALNGAQDLAVTPDGAGLYVTAGDSKAVAVFSRSE
jgi:6-phosphogluconolactonase (cycloisomerase 2 family)